MEGRGDCWSLAGVRGESRRGVAPETIQAPLLAPDERRSPAILRITPMLDCSDMHWHAPGRAHADALDLFQSLGCCPLASSSSRARQPRRWICDSPAPGELVHVDGTKYTVHHRVLWYRLRTCAGYCWRVAFLVCGIARTEYCSSVHSTTIGVRPSKITH